jgi:hypothetical protein
MARLTLVVKTGLFSALSERGAGKVLTHHSTL